MNELPSFDYEEEDTTNLLRNVNVERNDDLADISTNKGFRIGHLNINGLSNKIDDIKIMLTHSKLDILAISESKLNNDILDADISIPNFNLVRLDRDQTVVVS
jgi:hypothetical protein